MITTAHQYVLPSTHKNDRFCDKKKKKPALWVKAEKTKPNQNKTVIV